MKNFKILLTYCVIFKIGYNLKFIFIRVLSLQILPLKLFSTKSKCLRPILLSFFLNGKNVPFKKKWKKKNEKKSCNRPQWMCGGNLRCVSGIERWRWRPRLETQPRIDFLLWFVTQSNSEWISAHGLWSTSLSLVVHNDKSSLLPRHRDVTLLQSILQ